MGTYVAVPPGVYRVLLRKVTLEKYSKAENHELSYLLFEWEILSGPKLGRVFSTPMWPTDDGKKALIRLKTAMGHKKDTDPFRMEGGRCVLTLGLDDKGRNIAKWFEKLPPRK